MRLLLEIISGPLTGKNVIAEDHGVVRVGRTPKSDFPTDDGFMSGEHFSVEGDGKAFFIRDLKSRNGTRVNGKRVNSAELHEGDRVHAGSTDFVVHIETKVDSLPPPPDKRLLATLPPTIPPSQTQDKEWTEEVPPREKVNAPQSKRAPAKKITSIPEPEETPSSTPVATPPSTSASTPSRTPVVDQEREPVRVAPKPVPRVESPRPVKVASVDEVGMQSYMAVTPGGRLLHLLKTQSEPLLALVDATQEKKLLTMLKDSGDDYQSLYRDQQNAAIAPYLVSLPPDSELLRQMVQKGWGMSWGVYLTCSLPLMQLREYYRRELMVSLPDGSEMFSRFYDPRFFRVFLESCSKAEGEKFFGPVTSYLMEAEKPEIVLEFTRTAEGVEKHGHLLTDLD